MKPWSPDPAAATEVEAKPRDAWVAWLTHAPVHGVDPDRREPGGWAGFGLLLAVGGFWTGMAWMLFAR